MDLMEPASDRDQEARDDLVELGFQAASGTWSASSATAHGQTGSALALVGGAIFGQFRRDLRRLRSLVPVHC